MLKDLLVLGKFICFGFIMVAVLTYIAHIERTKVFKENKVVCNMISGLVMTLLFLVSIVILF